MNASEGDQRARVVEVARSWLGTRYHHNARIKGVGVDCATLLVEVFTEAGIIQPVVLPPYSPQWHLHRDEEKYVEFIRGFAQEAEGPPLPGDVVVWKFHRCFAHGAIVTAWPEIIHAFIGRGCILDDAHKNEMLTTVGERTPTQGQPRPMKIFSYWGRGHDPIDGDLLAAAGYPGRG